CTAWMGLGASSVRHICAFGHDRFAHAARRRLTPAACRSALTSRQDQREPGERDARQWGDTADEYSRSAVAEELPNGDVYAWLVRHSCVGSIGRRRPSGRPNGPAAGCRMITWLR